MRLPTLGGPSSPPLPPVMFIFHQTRFCRKLLGARETDSCVVVDLLIIQTGSPRLFAVVVKTELDNSFRSGSTCLVTTLYRIDLDLRQTLLKRFHRG